MGAALEALPSISPALLHPVTLSELTRNRHNSRSLYKKPGEQLSVSFRQANVYELPFESHSFDAAFAHGLFSHLQEPMRGFSEIRRVLKPAALIGLRDADWGGALTYPPDPVFESGVLDSLLCATLAPEHRFSEEPFLAQPWCEAVGIA